MIICPIHHADLDAVLRIQADAYRQELHESADTFARKLTLFPEGCVAVEHLGTLIAYVFSHPWKGEETIPLNADTLVLPSDPDSYYIHDLAIEPAYHGHHIGHLLVDHLRVVCDALSLHHCILVSVQDSEHFWNEQGFTSQKRFQYTPTVSAVLMMMDV